MADRPIITDATAPTGSVGPTGVTGQGPTIPAGTPTSKPPAHPHQVPNPNYVAPHIKPQSWHETPQGVHLEGAYSAFRTAFAVTMPSQRQQLQHLARRPIGG